MLSAISICLIASLATATKLIELSRQGTVETISIEEKAVLFVEDEKYYLSLKNIYSRAVELNLASKDIILSIDETEKIDLNSDYIYDLSLKIKSISETSVKIEIISLNEVYSEKFTQAPVIESVGESVEPKTGQLTETKTDQSSEQKTEQKPADTIETKPLPEEDISKELALLENKTLPFSMPGKEEIISIASTYIKYIVAGFALLFVLILAINMVIRLRSRKIKKKGFKKLTDVLTGIFFEENTKKK